MPLGGCCSPIDGEVYVSHRSHDEKMLAFDTKHLPYILVFVKLSGCLHLITVRYTLTGHSINVVGHLLKTHVMSLNKDFSAQLVDND